MDGTFSPTPTAESVDWSWVKPLTPLDSEKTLSAPGLRVPHRVKSGDSQTPQQELAWGTRLEPTTEQNSVVTTAPATNQPFSYQSCASDEGQAQEQGQMRPVAWFSSHGRELTLAPQASTLGPAWCSCMFLGTPRDGLLGNTVAASLCRAFLQLPERLACCRCFTDTMCVPHPKYPSPSSWAS